MVVNIVNEYMRELLKVQTLTPGSFPVYPLLTFLITFSWNLVIFGSNLVIFISNLVIFISNQ